MNVSLSADFEGWVDVNTTSAAAQWNFFPATNLGLYMMVKNEYGNFLNHPFLLFSSSNNPGFLKRNC